MNMRLGFSGIWLQTKLKYVDMGVWIGVLQEEQDTGSYLYNNSIIKGSSFMLWVTINFFTSKEVNAFVL